MELEKLFNKVIDIAYNVQKKSFELIKDNKIIDGRKVWGEIESSVKDIDVKKLNFHYCDNTKFYADIDSLNLIDNANEPNIIDGKINPKYNHFLLQLKNLVLTKSVDKIIESHRLFQIAYNLGQLKYNYENNIIPNEMKQVIDNNIDIFTIRKFVNDDTIEKLNSLYKTLIIDINLDDSIYIMEQKGGSNYYDKYMKYKTKYVELKKLNI